MSDIGQRIGAAGNQAATVLQGVWRAIADGTISTEQVADVYGNLLAEFVNAMETVEKSHNISAAFPGTTVATPAEAAPFQQQAAQGGPFGNTAQVVPFPAQQTAQNFQPSTAPQQVPGSSHKDDAKWQQLFANPSAFYDNRTNKRNPNGPDFKEKNGDTALWLQGKFGPAPQWVFDRLQGGQGPVQ